MKDPSTGAQICAHFYKHNMIRLIFNYRKILLVIDEPVHYVVIIHK